MNIYFAASIRGGRSEEDRKRYASITEILQAHGTVLTEHVGDVTLGPQGESMSDQDIYERDVEWIMEADIVVAELTNPSLGVGYEIGKAEAAGKRILCLHRPDANLSAMIAGNPRIENAAYGTLDEARVAIDNFFKEER